MMMMMLSWSCVRGAGARTTLSRRSGCTRLLRKTETQLRRYAGKVSVCNLQCAPLQQRNMAHMLSVPSVSAVVAMP